jgi:hypothetical protein
LIIHRNATDTGSEIFLSAAPPQPKPSQIQSRPQTAQRRINTSISLLWIAKEKNLRRVRGFVEA